MYAKTFHREDDLLGLAIVAAALLAYRLRRARPPPDNYGSAAWMSDKLLRAWGLIGRPGLVVGRTLSGHLIRLPTYCHTLVIGSTGSGKSVGLIVPALHSYLGGSVVCFDPKGELLKICGDYRRKRGDRVVDLDPFGQGDDRLNPLDFLPRGPGMVEEARALAAGLVVPEPGSKDPHWDAKAQQVAAAVVVGVLLLAEPVEQTLNSVQDIASDAELLWGMADRLQKLSGIPARLGSQVKGLFEKPGVYTREGASVMSTLARHLAWLDSESVGANVASSTFDVAAIRRPGTAVFLRIREGQLEATKGLLRVWTSTLVRAMASAEAESETLFLLDECSALGGLPALEEALVRGRSAKIRLLLAYQSDSQVREAFASKPTLVHDNSDTKIHMGVNGLEGAERLSKILGGYTGVLHNPGSSSSASRNTGGQSGGSVTGGESVSTSFHERPLMRVEELLRLGDEFLVATHRGLPQPILARRVKWFSDPAFSAGPARRRWRRRVPREWRIWLVPVAILLALAVRAKIHGYGYWAPEARPAARYEAWPVEPRAKPAEPGRRTPPEPKRR